LRRLGVCPSKLEFILTKNLRICPQLALIRVAYPHIFPKRPASTFTSRRLASSMAGPPKHEMVHFPNMTTSLPASSGEFRRVLWTGLYSQVVLMTIPVGGDIGEEVHTVDQALTFTSGTAKATVGGKEKEVKAGDLVIVPAGTQHQFENTGPTPLILYTIYSPAEHNPSTVHKTKDEGDELEEAGKDEAPEWSQKSKKENKAAGLV